MMMVEGAEGPVEHNVFPVTLRSFAMRWLAWDIDQPLDALDWLTIPSQSSTDDDSRRGTFRWGG